MYNANNPCFLIYLVITWLLIEKRRAFTPSNKAIPFLFFRKNFGGDFFCGERRDRTFTIPLHKLLGALNIVMISPLKHECIFIVPIGVNRANTVRLSYRCVPLSRSAGINAIRIFHILWVWQDLNLAKPFGNGVTVHLI